MLRSTFPELSAILIASVMVCANSSSMAATISVAIRGDSFYPQPQNVMINTGDAVRWFNADKASIQDGCTGTGNSYRCEGYLGEWRSPWICIPFDCLDADSFTFTFDRAGTYVYRTFIGTCNRSLDLGTIVGVGTITVKSRTNNPPAITLNSPIEGFQFSVDSGIFMLASVTNQSEDVAAVEFFANDILLGDVFQPPYRLGRRITQPGIYSLTAQVTDGAGNVATSEPVTITVLSDWPIPTRIFSSQRLANGAFLCHYVAPSENRYSLRTTETLGGPLVSGAWTFGPGTFLDTNAPNSSMRFYRIVFAP